MTSKHIILRLFCTHLPSLETLRHRKARSSSCHIALFGDFDPSGHPRAIEDPYYGGRSGFEKCYELCVRHTEGFLNFLERERGERDDSFGLADTA